MRILRLIRTRPRAGRALVGVLAGGLLSVGQGSAPLIASAVSPSVVVIYKNQWSEQYFPAFHLFGQVRNDTSQAVTGIRIGLNLQDINGNSVGTETAYPTLDALAPGEISPFEAILFPAPAGYAKFAIAGVTYARSTATPNHARLPVHIVACPSPIPASNICGTVANTGTVSLEGVHVALTLVNGGGTMVAQHYANSDASSTDVLAAGDTGTFAIDPAGDPAYTGVVGTGEAAYPIDVKPPALDFGNQLVGSPSQSLSVTVRNKGTRAVAIQNIAAPTDFAATSACPANLGAGASCSIGVVFTPSVMGPRGGLLVITNDGGGSPDSIVLSGVGVAPIVQLVAIGGADFGPIDVGKSSPARPIILSNVGTAPLVVTNIATTAGDFWRPQPNACVGTLAINASCVIYVVFTPGLPGTRNGSLVLTDNALDTPQQLALTGFGVGSAVTFNPTSLNFGDANVVVTDLPLTLINAGTGSLTITDLSTDGPFAASTAQGLPITVASGHTCTIIVTFLMNSVSALGPGLVVGQLTVTDSAGSHYVTLLANPASARGPVQFDGNPTPRGAPGPPVPSN